MDRDLYLVNDPEISTWRPEREKVDPRVLDLAWVGDRFAWGMVSLGVDRAHGTSSDHCPLLFAVDAGWRVGGKKRVLGEEARKDYLEKVVSVFKEFEFRGAGDAQELEVYVLKLEEAIFEAWNSVAKVPRYTRHSKSWWNDECTIAAHDVVVAHSDLVAAAYRRFDFASASTPDRAWHMQARDHLKACRRDLKGAVRRAKREHFDHIMHDVASENKHPWNLVAWTQPRRQ